MRKFLVLVIVILICAEVSAVRINEIEANPKGSDSGNEWIELYSKKKTEVSDLKIKNNDGEEIELSDLVDEEEFSGYLVIKFEGQWLDNKEERVYLYKNEKLEDKTDLLDDEKNDERSWQFCDGKWEFKKSTDWEKNDCEKKEEVEEAKKEEKQIEENRVELETEEKKDRKRIILSSKKEEIEYESRNWKIKENAIYFFALFCVLFIIYLLIRR